MTTSQKLLHKEMRASILVIHVIGGEVWLHNFGGISDYYLSEILQQVRVRDKVMSWIRIFHSGCRYYCGNIRISWKYPRSVDIIRILRKYPR